MSKKGPLTPDVLRKLDAWWRASNYLAAGQLYLRDNPLLRSPLKPEHLKHAPVGHWGTVPGQNFIYTHLNRVITNPSDAPYFPKTRSQISTSGLPITGMKEGVQVKGGENQQIEIEIVHAVAKVVLYVDNQSGEPFTLQQVNFGPFIADRTYLFDKSQQLPDGVQFNEMPLNAENVEVTPDKDEAVFTGYIYETGSQDISDFTLSLVSNTKGFEALATPVTIHFDEAGRNYINRNDQVEIRAIVNIHKEVETDLDILVVPWGEKDIEVPPFS